MPGLNFQVLFNDLTIQVSLYYATGATVLEQFSA
jgi:hypothetical protein